MGKKLLENHRPKRRTQLLNASVISATINNDAVEPVSSMHVSNAIEEMPSLKNYKRKQKITSTVKAGRPFNHQLTILKFTEIDHIKNCLLQYLANIGYMRGLVFTTKERQMLREEQEKNRKTNFTLPPIEWDLQHGWQQGEQSQKIAKILKQENIPLQLEYPKLHEHLLAISDIFPRETTGQIYRLMLSIYVHITQNSATKPQQKQKQIHGQTVERIVESVMQNRYEKYYFMTGCFSLRFKSPLIIEGVRDELIRMVDKVCRYVGFLVKK